MGIADWIRIARGRLTPGEIAERDAAVRDRAQRAGQQAEVARADSNARAARSERLRRAAAISVVELICHRDTWQFIFTRCYDHATWTMGFEDDRIASRNGQLVVVPLSGPHVVVALDRMWDLAAGRVATSRVSQAIAARLYHLIATVVDQVDPNASGGSPVPPIVVDDRPATGPHAPTDEPA